MCHAGKLDSSGCLFIDPFSFIITPFRTLGISFSARDIEMIKHGKMPKWH